MKKLYLKIKKWIMSKVESRKSIEVDRMGLIVLRNYIPADIYVEEVGRYLLPLNKVKNRDNISAYNQSNEALFISPEGNLCLMRHTYTTVDLKGKPYLILIKRW